ncbi:hypothetical protein BUALT_Bualt10G0060500 [Buddleja alternifolia]|uniref:mRNA (guanine-N(7))-methyltransferase n=1 Tax=Buddleja alternifolia TaxID=168488 RepID=A0AAV6WWF8_9LAMI|nr:hypothetical protein BUALT_Bualt10G0060500 [Buddleja alternifolia]
MAKNNSRLDSIEEQLAGLLMNQDKRDTQQQEVHEIKAIQEEQTKQLETLNNSQKDTQRQLDMILGRMDELFRAVNNPRGKEAATEILSSSQNSTPRVGAQAGTQNGINMNPNQGYPNNMNSNQVVSSDHTVRYTYYTLYIYIYIYICMERSYQESSSSASYGPPQSKFKHDPEGDLQFSEDHTKIVADPYSGRTNQTLEQREASPIIHLKKLNNWLHSTESVLIQLYAKRGDAVLDLACGKIEDCRTRYNGDADHHQRRKKYCFPARLICGDCFEVRLDKFLAEDAPFDICSCQFAMHYSWSTEARARRTLVNVSALLRPGGIFIGTMPDANVIIKKLREAKGLHFGNIVYWIRFNEEFENKKLKSSSPFGIKYTFHLEHAVDCAEWIVPFPVFKAWVEEYGFELVFVKNSHVFVEEYLKKPELVALMRRLGALGDGKEDQSKISLISKPIIN